MRRPTCLFPALTLGLMLLTLRPVAVGAGGDKDEGPEDVPVEVTAVLDDADLATLGQWQLKLTFLPVEDVGRPYRIQLQLAHHGDVLVDLTHAPVPPTPRWKAGEEVTYEIAVPVPMETGLDPGAPLDLTLGFYDPEFERLVKPRTDTALWGRLLPLARLALPEPPDADAEEHILAVGARARALAEAGRKADAWAVLELGLRQAKEDAAKERYRDVLLELAPYEARPPSLIEKAVVKGRIAAERRRYLRLMSGRYYRQGKLVAALRLLEEIGGTLEEDVDDAVIGALADQKRTQKDIDEIRVRLLGRATDEEKAEAGAAIDKYQTSKRLFDLAVKWAKKKHYAPARILFRHLSTSGNAAFSSDARERLEAVEKAWLAETPKDEAALVAAAREHPAFERLATSASQRFLFIGPRTLVEGIPQASRLRFDLAYVFLTDLFGRLPNPAGDRITVYFKELWDFGGGQGGGRKIDIGRADPTQRGYRVDTGLLYHELTHCVDDTNPILAGWREGLADFGAVHAFEALGQKAGQYHGLRRSLDAFQHDYLERDLSYWRIQNYAVSAGFFLHFVDAYSLRGDGHDWKPYRQFFREYRLAPVRDGREPTLIRAFAHYLVRAFGPKAFDDLIRYRLPLLESDRKIIGREVEVFEHGEHRVASFASDFEASPNSPLPRDLLFRKLLELWRRRRDAAAAKRFAFEQLGIVHDWRVVGPFSKKGVDPRAFVFPPEREIDFEVSYPNGLNTCKWWRTEPEGVVSVSPTGWVSFNFSYMDQTATYALANVVVPEAQEAHIHVRANDDLALFVNDRRVEDYVTRGDTGSRSVWWRGAGYGAPDAQRFVVKLHEGRNKILLKVKNRWGGSGFCLAVSKPDGTPIPGMAVDLDPPEAPPVSTKKMAWRDVVQHTFRTKSFRGKLEPSVGAWKVVKKRLEGQSKDKGVPWRKYTVRPGFPKDSPSNLFWFREKHTEGLEDFRLRLDLQTKNGRGPKILVAFEGGGGDDPLAGWALILHARGKGKKKVQARLERYEMLLYQSEDVAVPEGETMSLRLTLRNDALTVELGEAKLFDAVSVRRIPGRTRIGVATWGPDPGITAFELKRPKTSGER